MRTDDFAYHLPPERIAQQPLIPRDACRLLVLDRATGAVSHRAFLDIADYLHLGDLLVVNETRVLPARLQGRRCDTGSAVEVLLLKELSVSGATYTWECLVKPGKRVRTGAALVFSQNDSDKPALYATVVSAREEGIRHLAFTPGNDTTFADALHSLGTVPLPPYIKLCLNDPELYQTVYARSDDEHSAAAPTAGLHFTPELLSFLQSRGIARAAVRLDVGLDTFRPVSEDDPTHHRIHTEYYHVPAETQEAIRATRERGQRVVAVGTTAVRALESWADSGQESGATSLYILPGYEFRVTDALITNFHVPRSTLMMLVSAFASRGHILAAYDEALREGYRFLSFGDAMLII